MTQKIYGYKKALIRAILSYRGVYNMHKCKAFLCEFMHLAQNDIKMLEQLYRAITRVQLVNQLGGI